MDIEKKIKSLCSRRQAGFKNQLAVNAIWVEIDAAKKAKITINFRILGFDDLGAPVDTQGKVMAGINLQSASCPDNVTGRMDFDSLHKLEFDVLTAAWRTGAIDVNRWTGPNRNTEWLFKPNPDKERQGVSPLFPARVIPANELMADAQQQIYEF